VPLIPQSPQWSFYRVLVSPMGTIGGFHLPWAIAAFGAFGVQYIAPYHVRFRWGPSGDLMGLTSQYLYVQSLRDRSMRALTTPTGSDLYWSPCGDYSALDRALGAQYGNSSDLVLVEVRSARVQRLLGPWAPILAIDGLCWSPFRDEIAFIPRSGVYPIEIFKVSTGLPPTPAVFGSIVPGTTIKVRLRSAPDANRPYVVGAALGRDRGIATARGRIPLDPDPLLGASLSGIAPFRGFQGALDANGRADAFIDVPSVSALEGLRIFVGYVTLDPAQPGGLATISGSIPVFVQPTW